MKRLCLIFVLVASTLSAQVEYSAGVTTAGFLPQFYIETALFKSSQPNKARLDVFLQIPYAAIQFVKKENSFNASYSVNLTFYDDKKDNILMEKSWKERITTNDFAQTLSRNNFNISYRSFDINPRQYIIRCVVEDSDSKRSSSREFPINAELIADSLGISDLIIISEIVKDSAGERILPNISRIVTNSQKDLTFYHDVYSNRSQDVYIEYTIENLKNNNVTKQSNPLKVEAGSNRVFFTMGNMDFKLGDYKLRAILKNKDFKDISVKEKLIHSKIAGMPNSITDIDKAVEQILYIASPEEKEFIESSKTYDEKLNRFLEFWEKKKPNQKTAENPILYEYYRRIEYANKHFKGLGEGWRSDMGMIYVTFGPPSQVERHPLDIDSKPYEIWDYFELNRSFIFLDQTGFGDYRLVNPDYSRWPGYRP